MIGILASIFAVAALGPAPILVHHHLCLPRCPRCDRRFYAPHACPDGEQVTPLEGEPA